MYQGKHRALVTNVNDPDKMGRIRVQCPKLLGEHESSWCLPCVPFDGLYMLPNVGDMVWIEFEDNDPDLPIWVGSLWGQNQTPLDDRYAKTEQIKILKKGDLTIELDISDTGSIKIYNKDNTRLSITKDNTIELLNKSGAGITISPSNSVVIKGSKIDFQQI